MQDAFELLKYIVAAVVGGGMLRLLQWLSKDRRDEVLFISSHYRKVLMEAREQSRKEMDELREECRKDVEEKDAKLNYAEAKATELSDQIEQHKMRELRLRLKLAKYEDQDAIDR